MARRTFAPHTKKEDERLITREQFDFSGGLYEDLPITPENGVAKLEDLINYGDRLEVRAGCKKWSNTRLPNISGRGAYTASKTGSTVTISVGGDFTSADIGNFFYWSDTATYERITAVGGVSSITVHTTATHTGSVANCYVRGQPNCHYFHKNSKKIILHIGTKVYMADDLDISAWTEVPCISYDAPSNAISVMDELDSYCFIFTSNGTFKFDTTATTPLMYRINSPIPHIKLTSSGSGTYKRRYVYAMARETGTAVLRNRQTTGVSVEIESGSNTVDTNYQDYAQIETAAAIDSGAGVTVSTLTVPVDAATSTPQYHWTHYAIFATLDIGTNGVDPITGEGNNEEIYVWLMDVPVAKSFVASRTGTTVTATAGSFALSDVGSTITFQDGSTGTIASYTSTSEVETSGSGAIASQAATIGAASVFTGSQSTTTVTRTAGATFAAADVGKTIFWPDGTRSHITAYSDANTVTVAESQTIASTGAAYDATSRSFYDETPDSSLRPRIANYALIQRFWVAMPQNNVGVVVPGYMFTASRDDDIINYCQLPSSYESLAGYHDAYFQYTKIKDRIKYMAEWPDKVVVFGSRSTHGIPINTFDTQDRPDVGISVVVLSGQNVIDQNIGLLDHGSFQFVERGLAMMITNEPSVRQFDGDRYSEDLSYNRIATTLRSLQHAYGSSYDPFNGYIFWGLA